MCTVLASELDTIYLEMFAFEGFSTRYLRTLFAYLVGSSDENLALVNCSSISRFLSLIVLRSCLLILLKY